MEWEKLLSLKRHGDNFKRKRIDQENLKIDLEIDGGIDFETGPLAIKAGANILVSGSTVFKENNGDLKKNIQLLRTN